MIDPQAVAAHLLAMIASPGRLDGNWGTGVHNGSGIGTSRWDVTDNVYINGVLVTIDGDFEMGYVIEVVERDSSAVEWFTVTTFPRENPDGTWMHACTRYPVDRPQFFFDRTVDHRTVSLWGVEQFYIDNDAYYRRLTSTD